LLSNDKLAFGIVVLPQPVICKGKLVSIDGKGVVIWEVAVIQICCVQFFSILIMNLKLSTDELFHFTKLDRLLNIIKQGFYPRYNLEYTLLSNFFDRPGVFTFIPMVCFCDTPLKMAHEHSLKYGKFAIGLDKRWGERYGLNPVLYIHKNTIIGDAISALANSFSEYKSSMIAQDSNSRIFPIISQIGIGIQQLSYFVKQYERIEDEHIYIGDKRCTFPKGRFYDER